MKNQILLNNSFDFQGILPIDKPAGVTAFHLVWLLRKRLGIQTIGHAGTLDPFATGVMIMLVGRPFTRLSDRFLNQDKEYLGRIHLGIATDTFDCEGAVLSTSQTIPSQSDILEAIKSFQGEILQQPPMYSAKKVNGKKLYELARKGQVIERKSVSIKVQTEIVDYNYPHLDIRVSCSKGTYIRSLANDLGALLNCGGHLTSLRRTRSGVFTLADCFPGEMLESKDIDLGELQKKYHIQLI